jgi:nucleotide-binding universal stress UspA family protein
MTGVTGGVVAGFDGSPESWAAVGAAAWEADRRGWPLTLVHGYGPPALQPVGADVLAEVRGMVSDAAIHVAEAHPDLSVHTRLSAAGGATTLVEASHTASLVVVGARGHGGFAGLSVGSVAAQTAAHAACPVLVIRGSSPDDPGSLKSGPVVVGISRSEHDRAALDFAFEEATLCGVPVVGVHVWWFAKEVGESPDQYDEAVLDTAARRVVAEAMADWSRRYPTVAVEQRPVRSMNSSATLIDESARAGLMVVGCRGRGGFASLLLGSVSRDLIGHADAPVAVAHDHS